LTRLSQRILKLRRDRWRDKVIDVGKKLRREEAYRAGLDSDTWPEECAVAEANIDRLTRRRDSLLNNLKETASDVRA
jgi:hypothetical protein